MTFEEWCAEEFPSLGGGSQRALMKDAWDAAVVSLSHRWTTEPPSAPGWYWLKLPGEQPVVCKVWRIDASLPLDCFAGHVGEFESQWCGPLSVPGEGTE